MYTQQCTKCILDNTISDIKYDENGVCNFCVLHEQLERKYPISDTFFHQIVDRLDGDRTGGRAHVFQAQSDRVRNRIGTTAQIDVVTRSQSVPVDHTQPIVRGGKVVIGRKCRGGQDENHGIRKGPGALLTHRSFPQLR